MPKSDGLKDVVFSGVDQAYALGRTSGRIEVITELTEKITEALNQGMRPAEVLVKVVRPYINAEAKVLRESARQETEATLNTARGKMKL